MTEIKLDEIISKAVSSVLSPEQKEKKAVVAKSKKLDEAYVAQQKKYNQVTEYVSEKTKAAHTDLYASYVKSLNNVSAKLDSIDKSLANGNHSDYRSLKLDEVYTLNATWLHELYFANCFDPHSEIFSDSLPYMKLERDFGTFENWQKDFMACALSCGEGWVVCGYNMFLKKYVNTIVSHHSSDVMMGLYPIIVVDMWAHSYYKDYLNDKKSYLVSQMKEFNWEVIEERLQKAESISSVLR